MGSETEAVVVGSGLAFAFGRRRPIKLVPKNSADPVKCILEM